MARLNQQNNLEQNIDILRRRFLNQNKAMAQSLSKAQEKIVELEQRIQALSAENYSLRQEIIHTSRECENAAKDRFIAVRDQLAEKWAQIEGIVARGFHANVEVQPIEQPFVAVTTRKSRGPRRSNIYFNDDDKYDDGNGFKRTLTTNDSVIEELTEGIEGDLLDNENELSDEKDDDKVLLNDEKEEGLKEPLADNEELAIDLVNEDKDLEIEVNDLENAEFENANQRPNEKAKHDSILLPLEPAPIISPSKSSIQIFLDEASKPTPGKPPKTKISAKAKALKQKTNISPVKEPASKPPRQVVIPETVKSPEPTNPAMSRRRSSRGGQINYAEPSLKHKMRRQSTNPVAAVGQENEAPARKRRKGNN